MQSKKIYTLSETKPAMAYFEGFMQEGRVLYATGSRHYVILNRFRSYEKNTKWGRFHCKRTFSQSSTLRIYILSKDAEEAQANQLNQYFHDSRVPWPQKRACFEQEGAVFVNHEDVLLYAFSGEYLWIAIEIEDHEIEDHEIKPYENESHPVKTSLYDMYLDSQGDNFMQTFPEIYQEEGEFFHRYMSIFSSVYQDLSDKIANMDQYFDIRTTPMPVLREIAGWLGFEATGDFLEEEMLRSLIQEIYQLNRIKGRKEVLRKLIRVILGNEAFSETFIIERNRLEGYIPNDMQQTYQKLYGESAQDVTILVKIPENEKLQQQVMYLLRQFKPVRSRIRLVFCQRCSHLDSYCYLDYNAALAQKGLTSTDQGSRMNGTVILQ